MKDMNTLSKQLIAAVLCMAGFITIMGVAGSYDYATEVIQSMPEGAYYAILDTMGDDCSEKAIAEEYMNNREYYDNRYK